MSVVCECRSFICKGHFGTNLVVSLKENKDQFIHHNVQHCGIQGYQQFSPGQDDVFGDRVQI